MGKNKKGLMVAFLVLFLLLGVYFLLKSLNLEEEPETANAVKTVFDLKMELFLRDLLIILCLKTRIIFFQILKIMKLQQNYPPKAVMYLQLWHKGFAR